MLRNFQMGTSVVFLLFTNFVYLKNRAIKFVGDSLLIFWTHDIIFLLFQLQTSGPRELNHGSRELLLFPHIPISLSCHGARGHCRCARGKEPTCQFRRHETQIRSLDQEDPLKEDMTTHSSILAWRIPWREEPGGLQSIGSQRIRHNWSNLYACTTGPVRFRVSNIELPYKFKGDILILAV